jgi:2,3-bisphosphoglycerate-dependent phosphoglycerate mutase
MPAAELHAGRREHLDRPYPGGESWRQATARVGRFLADLSLRWNGQRILVIGHVATRWGLDHFLGGARLEDLIEQDFAWREGWEYRLVHNCTDLRRFGSVNRIRGQGRRSGG